jgi:putative transposase
VAERLVKSIRNELLNHVVVFSKDHLRRLMKEYMDYYNKDRCHLFLNRDSPLGRKVQQKPSESGKVISISKLSGLQHRYQWQKTA